MREEMNKDTMLKASVDILSKGTWAKREYEVQDAGVPELSVLRFSI